MPQLGKILGAATALSGPGLVGNPSKEQGEATGVVRYVVCWGFWGWEAKLVSVRAMHPCRREVWVGPE